MQIGKIVANSHFNKYISFFGVIWTLHRKILGHLKTNMIYRVLQFFFNDCNINMYINSIINICTNDAFNYTSQMTPEFFPYKFQINLTKYWFFLYPWITILQLCNNYQSGIKFIKKCIFKDNILHVEWVFPWFFIL